MSKVVGWGPDIISALAPTGYPKPGITKIEWFKLALVMNGGVEYFDAANLPPLPSGMTDVDVVTDWLSNMRQGIRLHLQREFANIFSDEEHKIAWNFAVPPYLSPEAKAKLQTAIIRAGYLQDASDDRLTFVDDHKALAFSSLHAGLAFVEAEDAILVVDAGGATVDLISYKVVAEHPLELVELAPLSGDSCGFVFSAPVLKKILI